MQANKILMVLISAMLAGGSLPLQAFAASDMNAEQSSEKATSGSYSKKNETVYGNLNENGSVRDMYVINSFHVTEPGVIVDYGDYENVRNLSNLSDIKQSQTNKVKFEADSDDYYYQGDMDNQSIPWDIDISYILDGKDVSPDDLAGKDGPFELQISTSANTDANPAFFENYMLQITVTMDSGTFDAIQAPEGTKASAGKNTQVTFTVMPEKEETFIVSANAEDFEMAPVEIAATPASIPIEDPDLSEAKENMKSLADGVRDIYQGVVDLNVGISDLNGGAQDLEKGSDAYENGLNKVDRSSGDLISGSKSIGNALQTINDQVQSDMEVPDLSELEALPQRLRELEGGLRESAEGLTQLKKTFTKAYNGFDEAMKAIPTYDIKPKQIRTIRERLGDESDQKTFDQLTEIYQTSKVAIDTYSQAKPAFDAVPESLEQTSGLATDLADSVNQTADQLESSLQNTGSKLGAINELQNGLSSLASRYEDFHNGLVEYTSGVGELNASYKDISSGIASLRGGVSDLSGGADELQQGTGELKDETSDLPNELQSEIDEMLEEYDASDFDPISFVSEKNDKVDIVQFVLQTQTIETDEPDIETDEVEEEKGIWERFLDLFRS